MLGGCFFFPFLSGDALLPYHSSPIGRHHLHVDAFIAEVLWCPAHKIKICRLMLASCSKFEYFWGLNPHIHPFYVSTGTKCCAEHKYAYMQPLRLLFFILASSFLRFWALHRFKTRRRSFTQICPGIVLLFWAQRHAHIKRVQDPISITKLKHTETNQRIIWDQEKRSEKTRLTGQIVPHPAVCADLKLCALTQNPSARGFPSSIGAGTSNPNVEDLEIRCIVTAQKISFK